MAERFVSQTERDKTEADILPERMEHLTTSNYSSINQADNGTTLCQPIRV